MMCSDIVLFGHSIPLYGICFWAGVFLCGILAVILCKRHGLARYDLVYSAVFVMIGAMIGAKLLFILVSMRQILALDIPLMAIIKGGFVFYGGLGGGALGAWIYAKIFQMPFLPFFDLYAIVVPLGHAVGRIGCFFAGCCYGMPYDGPLHCVYTQTVGHTPLNIPLFPIQLLEAFFLLLLFGIGMLFSFQKNRKPGAPSYLYLIAYPILRFVLEFFRGDRERGLFFGLSTSQWISLLILSAVCLRLLVLRRKKTA